MTGAASVQTEPRAGPGNRWGQKQKDTKYQQERPRHLGTGEQPGAGATGVGVGRAG